MTQMYTKKGVAIGAAVWIAGVLTAMLVGKLELLANFDSFHTIAGVVVGFGAVLTAYFCSQREIERRG